MSVISITSPRKEIEILTITTYTLCFHAMKEAQICDADDEPSDQPCHSSDVDEPTKHNTATRFKREIYEWHEYETCRYCEIRRAKSVCLEEPLWCLAFFGKTEQCSRGQEHARASAAESTCADDRVAAERSVKTDMTSGSALT